MARKYDLISELYNRTCKTVVSNPQNWQAFLASACRNYKLRYDEQLLVYAQRPDATAVLEIEQWNKIFGRWVNRGARGIAVFADENRSRQRLTHYFDISDTHESRYSRTVPIWDMRQEYEADVIETLESTFGEIENKSSLAEAIMGAARNAAEDNIPDYLQDLYYATEGSSFEEVEEDIVAFIYKNVVTNSVAYMMMSRLGVDTDGYFELDDFRDVTNFNTQETLNALGFATSDIAEMGLTEISKTITALNRQNRIIVGQDRNEYNKVENNDERSLDNERTDLHDGGRLQPSEPETSTAARSDVGQIRSDEERVSEGTSQSPLLQSPDEGRTDTALGGSGTESQQDGGNNSEPDGTERGSDRTDESGGYDEMGSSDELPSQFGTGNRESGSDIRLEYYDRTHEDKSLPFFGRDEVINEILRTTPHLSASLEEIKDYYERNPDNKDRTEYIKSIFNNDYTELTLEDGRTVGYKTFENVLHLWEGKYDSRTAQSFYDWAVIARHFEAMRLLGELSDSIKPLPSMDGQMTFILDGRAEEKKTSAFTFSQEIIDAILANGSGFSEGKMRIYEQFEKSLSAKENADFLKNEYGWGGFYPVIIGAGIDESHDGKGITITKGIGKENPHITLSWSQVEKRIGELIRMDRYLNPKEKERYPQWLESQEERRAKIEETKRNREILSNAPPEQEVEPAEKEPEEAEQLQDVQYEYHLGDKVYIGASEYEILSVDDERVMLYDYDVPLFNKEFSRTEFDRKVRENPMNEHLIVKEEPAEERNETEEVQTNMGSMPIEDYREIVASQSGFDSYDEMYHQGYRIGNGYDKEPEPVVPAWEQKKKVKGFDLHPDVSMAERHTFNLKENEVETVGKKERFRRNIMAIQLLKKCQEENRFATPEEQIILSKYVGWGGLSEAFDENNSAWATEYLELSSVLTPEEYASARESTLTAFYTPPEVITAIYKAMEQMGFKEGNLLEPSCGIGNFIGMLPDTMQDSKIYGVELDTISAGIAQQLYQKTTIAAQGFEETNLPDSFFDGVVGNVPFGDFKVSDKRYDKHKFLIHDYFFAKSLDKLRPGGVMVLVTSKGTMDKETLAVRKYIAQRAELLGAIRLPNNTFKGNAGTEVVSDILILQKRDRLIDIEPDWVHLDTDENGIKMNSYFVQHPEMILGEMKMVSGRFGMEATCVPYENADLAAQLDEAVANIHGEITEYEAEEELEEEDNSNQSVDVLLKTSSLFAPFPPEMGTDTAFLDRMHCYIPGWEIPKFRPQHFTNDYGFISDYLAEFIRELRKEQYGDALDKYFRLGKNLNQRDTIAVRKMVGGFIKLLYPDGEYTKEELEEVLKISLEMRRRVKEQLKKLGGMEFYDVNFSYIDNETFEEFYVSVPEQGGGKLIPEGMCNPGQVYTVAQGKTGMLGVFRLESQMMPGNGKFERSGLGSDGKCKEATNTAFNFLKANSNRISGSISTTTKDYIINYQDLQGIGMTDKLALPTLIALSSVALGKPVASSLAVLGEISIAGTLIKVDELANSLQVCLDSGAKKVLLPIVSAADIGAVPSDLIGCFNLIFYSSAEDAVYKALGVE